MRRTAVETAALAALLLGGALAWGQPAVPAASGTEKPKEEPARSKLEELLQKALQDNPDVRLAAAKVAEADAELNRARLLVVQKVATLYQAVEAQKAAVDGAAAELEETQTLFKSGAAPQGTLRDAEQKLRDAKAKLAGLEAEMPYLLGQQAVGVDAKAGAAWRDYLKKPSGGADAEMLRRYYLDLYGRLPTPEELAVGIPSAPSVAGPTADRIRAALDKPFTFDGKDQTATVVLEAMNKAFQEANPGLLIKNNIPLSNNDPIISAHFAAMPFGAALEWIEDSSPNYRDYRVVVRDYGVVITPKDQMPPGAPLLHDFWKGARSDEKPPTPNPAKEPSNPPAKHVEGVIQAVDAAGQFHLNIGSDDGIAKGDALEAWLLIPDAPDLSKYLGQIRVIETTAHESVAKTEGKMAGLVQAGVHVSRRMVGSPAGNK